MLSENEDFVFISPKERKKHYQSYTEFLDHNGKWVIYGKKDFIEGLCPRMAILVGEDGVMSAKFTKNPTLSVPEGHELGKDHAMIVYCDGRNREEVKKKLKEKLDVDEMLWKYDRETREEVMRSKVYDY
jgi:hypothetical protein